jgi:hypothetical protein
MKYSRFSPYRLGLPITALLYGTLIVPLAILEQSMKIFAKLGLLKYIRSLGSPEKFPAFLAE